MAIAQDRSVELLDRANRYLAGGGLGLFVLPPEVNLVIAEGNGSHITHHDPDDVWDRLHSQTTRCESSTMI